MGLISMRNTANGPELARVVKLKKLRDSHRELGPQAERLKLLIVGCKERTGAESLDIAHGSMASRTAQGVFDYLLTNWLAYLYRRIQSPRPDVMPDRREGITKAAGFVFACIDT